MLKRIRKWLQRRNRRTYLRHVVNVVLADVLARVDDFPEPWEKREMRWYFERRLDALYPTIRRCCMAHGMQSMMEFQRFDQDIRANAKLWPQAPLDAAHISPPPADSSASIYVGQRSWGA